jgi:apolipoprotein N-acyltransferase
MRLPLRCVLPTGLSILSGILMAAAFPKVGLSVLAWIGLVPVFLATGCKGKITGFLLFCVCGVCFLLGIFNWILEVPGYRIIHHVILALYLGFFFGVFGLAFCFIAGRWGMPSALFSAPFFWVSLEYLRSNMSFMALPWGLLAHSQYEKIALIQTASFAGVYGISFVVVLVNAGAAAMLLPYAGRITKGILCQKVFPRRAGIAIMGWAVAVLALSLVYGLVKMRQPLNGQPMRISIVQGNIDQKKKWDPQNSRMIMRTYAELTEAASNDRPALIVWPETAIPGALNRNPTLYSEVKRIAGVTGTYLLVGSAQNQKIAQRKPGQPGYLNSAYLIPPHQGSRREQRYDKIKLLPFGEYLPMKDVIPWSYIRVPDPGSYTSGEEFRVFELGQHRFASTICWENLFSDMVREFVKNGAQFIVNMTNEAWFGKTAAPYQFLSMNVFRAVENRVPVIRCANTGISCFIDPCGRVIDRVQNNGEDIFVQGYLTKEIVPSQERTMYTHYGDWFAQACMVISTGLLIVSTIRPVRGKNRIKGPESEQ